MTHDRTHTLFVPQFRRRIEVKFQVVLQSAKLYKKIELKDHGNDKLKSGG